MSGSRSPLLSPRPDIATDQAMSNPWNSRPLSNRSLLSRAKAGLRKRAASLILKLVNHLTLKRTSESQRTFQARGAWILTLCALLLANDARSQNLLLEEFGLKEQEVPVAALETKDAIITAEADYRTALEQMRTAKRYLESFQRRNKVRDSRYESRVRQLQEHYEETHRRVEQAEKVLRQASANVILEARTIASQSGSKRQENFQAAAKSAKRIDDYFESLWSASGQKPMPIVDDATFLRRASLDIVGTIPTADDLAAFLKDDRPNKREEWIDRLLMDPHTPDYWAMRVRSWILEHAPVVGQGANTVALFEYLREAIGLDTSYAAIAYDLVTAKGHSSRDGAVVFPILWEAKPADLGAATSSIFLGVNIQCAQCHDDMIEGWTQEDFWGMAAFFTGLESTHDGSPTAYPQRPSTPFRETHLIGGRDSIPGIDGDDRAVRFTVDTLIEIADPTGTKPKRTMGPRPLGESGTRRIPNGQRRVYLAQWMTSRTNPYFDRAVVNRVWSHFFGRGFAPTPDGFQPSATIAHESLLEALCLDFQEQDRSLRQLMRSIVMSQTYQRAIATAEEADEDYHGAALRKMDGDQWVSAVFRATGYETFLRSPENLAREPKLTWDLRWFRHSLAKQSGPVADALFELNTFWLWRSVNKGINLDRVNKLPKPERLDAVFLHVLSRPPTPKEREIFRELAEDGSPNAVQDLFRVLLGSTEFVTR